MKVRVAINYEESKPQEYAMLEIGDDSIVFTNQDAVNVNAVFISRLLNFVQFRFVDFQIVYMSAEKKEGQRNTYPSAFDTFPTTIRWERKVL